MWPSRADGSCLECTASGTLVFRIGMTDSTCDATSFNQPLNNWNVSNVNRNDRLDFLSCCRRSRAGSPAAPVCAAQIAALETRSNSNHRASDGPGLDVPALRLAPDSGCGFLQSAGFRRKRARFGRAVPVRHALAPGSVELWRRPCAPCITCVSVGKGAAATSSQANLH